MLKIVGDEFYLNEKPFVIRAGAIHYFRIPREYWKDRLEKLKACGLELPLAPYIASKLIEKGVRIDSEILTPTQLKETLCALK